MTPKRNTDLPSKVEKKAIGLFKSKFAPTARLFRIKTEGCADYFVPKISTIVEISEVYDKYNQSKRARWGTIVGRIKQAILATPALKKRVKKLNQTCCINTPETFKLHPKKMVEFMEQALTAIESNQRRATILGIPLQFENFSGGKGAIYFANVGKGGSIDSVKTIFESIESKIKHADGQIANAKKIHYSAKKGVLLLVNRYSLLLGFEDFTRALCLLYEDLLKLKHIDEIWLQLERKDGTTAEHLLLFSRDFLVRFNSGLVRPRNRVDQSQFEFWFWAFKDKNEFNEQSWQALKAFLTLYKPHAVFKDQYKRETMIEISKWLAGEGRFDEAWWLVNQFLDDPSPSEPLEGEGEKYHNEVLKADEMNTLTTVKGHLAWAVKELACKSERGDVSNLIKAFEMVKGVLTKSDNLYLIQQWLIPLTEIAQRRLWMLEEDEKNGTRYYDEFRKLILDPESGLVAKYGQHKAVVRNLMSLFDHLRDISASEAWFVLKKLLHSPGSDKALVYFALYRPNRYRRNTGDAAHQEIVELLLKHYPEAIQFDEEKKEILVLFENILNSIEEQDRELQSSIAWQFWKILEDLPQEFGTLQPSITKLFELPYDRRLSVNLLLILHEVYPHHPKEASKWFELFLNELIRCAAEAKMDSHDFWFDFDSLIELCKTHDSSRYLSIHLLLKRLQELGFSYINVA